MAIRPLTAQGRSRSAGELDLYQRAAQARRDYARARAEEKATTARALGELQEETVTGETRQGAMIGAQVGGSVGAQIGNAIVPGVGGAVGGLIGALVGAAGGSGIAYGVGKHEKAPNLQESDVVLASPEVQQAKQEEIRAKAAQSLAEIEMAEARDVQAPSFSRVGAPAVAPDRGTSAYRPGRMLV